MSDNIPFEIQSEIIKRLPVKSLIQFRTVSKPWKSLIDSSPFINKYSSQHTHTQRLLITYDDPVDSATTYVSIADDDTFPQQKAVGFSVWMMPDGVPQSFIRMFTIKSPDLLIKGFRKNGEPIIEMVQHHPGQRDGSFFVAYDPCSKDIVNLEIDVFARSFCVFPYMETLLLLDQPDFVIYDQGKATLQSVEPSDEGKNY
ncbi:putative F-box domain-containing protein [Helianthus annuus]|uniref:F-box domain-containing protein n=1 Tax=Helianthus annuus TaxID=4232 RepID=A0A251T0Q7_HELAN|nr:putative F-box domain-containing protein [Helianthus annuus]